MKKCAYCMVDINKQNRTKEHIIPDSLIKIFPEQDISFTSKAFFKDNEGLSIKDVCNKCNNGFLSELDSYGIFIIKEYFIKEYLVDDTLEISFDYTKLSRWLMKMAYNYSRLEKIEYEWFLNNINYINGNINEYDSFSLYAGLNIDMIPTTEESLGYTPLGIYSNLKFKPIGNFKYNELLKGNLIEEESRKLKSLNTSFLFRFGSIRFLLLLWDKDITEKEVEYNEIIMNIEFGNYTKILNKEDIVLQRVTDPLVCKLPNIIHGDIGSNLWTQYIEGMVGDIQEKQKYFKKFFKENSEGKILVEAAMFPDNKKVKKKYNELFGRE